MEVPEVDVIFAISANAQLNELANFRQMKDIINAMIDKYGRGDIMYAVIVYGEEPSRLVRFTTNFDSDEALMDYITKMRKGRGASLTKALQLAQEVNNLRHGLNKAKRYLWTVSAILSLFVSLKSEEGYSFSHYLMRYFLAQESVFW